MNTFIIIIPTYNEADCIEKVVRSWLKVVTKVRGSQILIVDGSSSDKTIPILKRIQSSYPQLTLILGHYCSHGEAIMAGYRFAIKTKHEYVFQTDSDGQVFPQDFQKVWKEKKNWKFIIGHRQHRRDPYFRIFVTRVVRIMIHIVFGRWITDANSPFRLIQREYLKKILRKVPKNVFAPNIFLSILAARDGVSLTHFPIHHRPRLSGRNTLGGFYLIRSCFRALKELIAFRRQIKF